MALNSVEEISKKTQAQIDEYEKAKEWPMEKIQDSYKEDIEALEQKKGNPSEDLIIDIDNAEWIILCESCRNSTYTIVIYICKLIYRFTCIK